MASNPTSVSHILPPLELQDDACGENYVATDPMHL